MSSRAESVRSVNEGFQGYHLALLELSSSNEEAFGLLKLLLRLETSINLVFWSDVLQRVQVTNLQLQKDDSDLNTSIALLNLLRCILTHCEKILINMKKQVKKNLDGMNMKKK